MSGGIIYCSFDFGSENNVIDKVTKVRSLLNVLYLANTMNMSKQAIT